MRPPATPTHNNVRPALLVQIVHQRRFRSRPLIIHKFSGFVGATGRKELDVREGDELVFPVDVFVLDVVRVYECYYALDD